MIKRYMLLNPLKGSNYAMSNNGLIKALAEHNCGHILCLTDDDSTVVYATAATPEILAEMCTRNEINGSMVEITGVYDMNIEEDQ